MAQPEIAILVSSFERPAHVGRVLASIAAQRGVSGAIEVVVTDDGSRDETPRLVRQFAASVSFPVRFTTHPHGGFHIARCRNEGVAAATAPYLLFLDGDCMIPPDHVRAHLERRRTGCAMAGYPIYFSRSVSEQITAAGARDGRYEQHVTSWQRLQMRWRHVRAAFYSLIHDQQRPKLLGGNLGIARADYERVNGYDPLPVIVAGGASGQLKGDRHLMFPAHTPMSNLMLALLDKLGAHQDRFGDSTSKLEI
jgi:glycosyltransferase involved in cell wall biosynthesis